jgi:hypothetical protein
MTRSSRIILVAVLAASTLAAAAAVPALTTSPTPTTPTTMPATMVGKTIYGCLTAKHTLSRVSVTKPPTCPEGTVPVQWEGLSGQPVPSPTASPTTTPTLPTVTPPAGSAPTAATQARPAGSAPTQPGLVVWGGSNGINAYAKPGAVVIAGRSNYGDQAVKDIAAAGGTVLIYLDPIIDNDYGRYHKLLNDSSACGPATSRWPGNPSANEWGNLNDFRSGSVLQQKLECVLETMVRENPHMGGFFADDVGSRSYFPLLNWGAWSDANRAQYRQGAIDLTKTFREVANRHGLVFIVNGSWNAGTSNAGGGYPDANKHGNALADGGFIEKHNLDTFFTDYATSPQWAAQSPITGPGRAINFAVNTTTAATQAWINCGCVAYAVTQSDYEAKPSPWGPFYDRGLPSGVSG